MKHFKSWNFLKNETYSFADFIADIDADNVDIVENIVDKVENIVDIESF